MKIAVVIPYFQREAGILRRALESIVLQTLPGDVNVEIIVVDDGSPAPSEPETLGLSFEPPFRLNLIKQPNSGVAAARNRALGAVSDDTRYVAFLDSDDSWHGGHLAQAIQALESGYDFYFCDNERGGVHASHFRAGGHILDYVEQGKTLVPVPKDALITMIIRECPTQASTVLYRWDKASAVRFSGALRYAGEDKLFFAALVSNMDRAIFSPDIMVDCGKGINMYFSQLNWDSEKHLHVVVDDLKAHYAIRDIAVLAAESKHYNAVYITQLRKKLAFLSLRRMVQNRGKFPPEVAALAQTDKRFWLWFCYYGLQVSIGRALGLYLPA